MSTLKIGMFEQDITPVGPVLLPGQFYKRVSTHVESEIKAEVFACEADGEQLIIVAVDAGGIARNLTELVHEKTAEKCSEIDVTKIILAATHIHTAPGYTQKRTGISFGYHRHFFTVVFRTADICGDSAAIVF